MDMHGYDGIFLVKRLFNSGVFEMSNMSDITKANPHGCDNGALTNRFGVLIQGLLAVVAFSTLMLKRFREPVGIRRPWRIWFFDTSKQAIGALFIHFANVFLSTLTEEDSCSLYLMNFLLDATLGMLVIWAGVKVVSKVVEHKQYTLLIFGEYGDPPQAAAWLGQCCVYLLIMVLEKSMVSVVLLIPGWTKSIMFWVVDSLMMRKYKSLKSLDDNCGSPEKAEGSPWVTDEESRVLLTADTDDPSEEEEAGLRQDSDLTPQGGSMVPGWVEV
ncbi:transmembrane protein 110, like isoform X2 [Osmerus mordax]|uniref:transmembrane protein 110, like isoform X2 n=1 Tax=Osmerus mordax TaxID=8014 RepID=UPI00350F441E